MSIQCRKNAIVRKKEKEWMVGTVPPPPFFARTTKCQTWSPLYVSPNLWPPQDSLRPLARCRGEPLWVGRPRTHQPLPHQVKHELLPPPSSPYTEPNLTYERPPNLSQWVVSRPPASGVVIRNADSWTQLRPAGTQAGPLFSSVASLVPGKVSCIKKMLNKYLGME